MGNKLQQMFADAFARIAAWPPQRQIGALLSVVAGVAVFSMLFAWSTHQAYVPLLTNLTEEDAGQIAERLTTDHVPFKLASQGSAILVPEEQVHALRLKLAGEGLPKGGNVGFELFDTPNFGMSRFAEQLNYRRGLEGELRRSIRQIESVQDARVHIVVPEQGLFREQDKQATAAVTLALRPGRHLSGGQVQAIVHLVASSVAGLAPDQVTIVDNSGNILAKGGDSVGGLSAALEQQRAVESGIEERVKAILAPIVGSGHVVVRASANLDFSHRDKTTESYDPKSAVMRSEQVSSERKTSGAAATGGVPGARSNLTGINKTPTTSGGGTNERSSATHNFEINKVVAHEVGAQGRLTRLSVAVLVDGVESVDADGKKTMTERTPEELARFGELVRRAMGFDDDRDDQVTVHSMAFEPVQPMEAPPPEQSVYLNYVERFWPPALAAIVTLVVLATFLRGKRSINEANANLSNVLAAGSGRTVQEIEQALGRAGAGSLSGRGSADRRALHDALLGTDAGALGFVPAGIVPKIASNVEPKVAAQVIKGWLNEG